MMWQHTDENEDKSVRRGRNVEKMSTTTEDEEEYCLCCRRPPASAPLQGGGEERGTTSVVVGPCGVPAMRGSRNGDRTRQQRKSSSGRGRTHAPRRPSRIQGPSPVVGGVGLPLMGLALASVLMMSTVQAFVVPRSVGRGNDMGSRLCAANKCAGESTLPHLSQVSRRGVSSSHPGLLPRQMLSNGKRTRDTAPTRGSSTQLNVWWFGGSKQEEEMTNGDDNCELVAVRIESPTPNSRRIRGEIVVPAPLEDVWAILTDYDNLAIHVPNLVESRRVPITGGGGRRGGGGQGAPSSSSVQGDGSFRCRLFQKGAQKIVGFEFGASVTMDMSESIIAQGAPRSSASLALPHSSSDNPGITPPSRGGGSAYGANSSVASTTNVVMERQGFHDPLMFPPERKIDFKCVESYFFDTFDGEWRVRETIVDGQLASTVSYVVDVKPRGPVPVMALEWRIREDVPTNLRAVKKAAVEVGYRGVMAQPNRRRQQQNGGGSANGQIVTSAVAGSLPPSSSAALMAGDGPMKNAIPAGAALAGDKSVTGGRRRRRNVGERRAAATTTSERAGERTVPVNARNDWDEDETMAVYLDD